MKLIVFRDGLAGQIVTIPGDQPEHEIAELLDGPVELRRLSRSLALFVREDGEARQLPIRYTLNIPLTEPEPIPGNCAAVAICQAGRLRDTSSEHMMQAAEYIKPAGGVV